MKKIEIIGIESRQEHEKIPNPIVFSHELQCLKRKKNGDCFYD